MKSLQDKKCEALLTLSCVLGITCVFGCGGSGGGGGGPAPLTRIVFAADTGGKLALYSMAPDGTNVLQLTNAASNDDQPNWSADGSKIVFRSDRDGEHEIYEIFADGSSPGRYTYRTNDSD